MLQRAPSPIDHALDLRRHQLAVRRQRWPRVARCDETLSRVGLMQEQSHRAKAAPNGRKMFKTVANMLEHPIQDM